MSNKIWGELHESKQVEIILPKVISAGEANRLFRELGATLDYDAYSFYAENPEPWQDDCVLSVDLLKNSIEVDAQDDFDQINAIYLFASNPSCNQTEALNIIEKMIVAFNGKAKYEGYPFTRDNVQTDWDSCNDYLLKEWGEEPGSESLQIMIEENYS